jgi:hypothetical protein
MVAKGNLFNLLHLDVVASNVLLSARLDNKFINSHTFVIF